MWISIRWKYGSRDRKMNLKKGRQFNGNHLIQSNSINGLIQYNCCSCKTTLIREKWGMHEKEFKEGGTGSDDTETRMIYMWPSRAIFSIERIRWGIARKRFKKCNHFENVNYVAHEAICCEYTLLVAKTTKIDVLRHSWGAETYPQKENETFLTSKSEEEISTERLSRALYW